MFGLFKKRKSYEKVISHDDWEVDQFDYGFYTIKAKAHKLGRKVSVSIQSPCPNTYFVIQGNGDVVVRRGLQMCFGTFFSVKVELNRVK